MMPVTRNLKNLVIVAVAVALAPLISILAAEARVYGASPSDFVTVAWAQPRPSQYANCVAQGTCWNNDDPCPNGTIAADSYTQCCQTVPPNSCAIVTGMWKWCGNQWKKHCKRDPIGTSTCIPPNCS